MDTEPMLLIDNRKAEVVEDDALLKQGMRADDDIDAALRESARGFCRAPRLCRGR